MVLQREIVVNCLPVIYRASKLPAVGSTSAQYRTAAAKQA
jgi:hypothetical protein